MKIDKKVPIPEKGNRSENAKVIEKMKIGDSVFFDSGNRVEAARFLGCAVNTFRKWKFTSRTTHEGMRIWRIK
jgi:hypothetical protein